MANASQQDNIVDVWDDVSEHYDPKTFYTVDNLANIEFLKNYFPDWKGKRVIEVGAGSGLTSLELAKLGAEVTLFDISQKSLDRAEKVFIQDKVPVKLVVGDALDPALKLEKDYDLVWNGGVIEHFEDAGKISLIQRMVGMVAPNGVVSIMVPNAHDWPFMIAKHALLALRKWPYGYEDDITPSRGAKLAADAGFPKAKTFAFNPVVGWWWLPLGKRLSEMLKRNTLAHHLQHSPFGHVTVIEIRREKDAK